MFLFSIDINGCYAQICLDMDFPHGNCQILIDKSLAEENIDFDFDNLITYEHGNILSIKVKSQVFGLSFWIKKPYDKIQIQES